MNEHTVSVNVVTPDGLVYDHHARLVTVKTTDGDIGLMANHAPIIAPLAIDVVKVRRCDSDDHVDYIAVSGGVIEMKDNLISIISDSAERERDIDLPRAERAKKRAEEAMERAKEAQDVDEEKRAQIALYRAVNRINVSKNLR